MTDATRRGFLVVAGAGTVSAAAVASAPAAFAAGSPSSSGARSTDSLVAHVTDAKSGTVSIMVGEDEIIVRDRDLVSRLHRAAGR